MTVNVCRKKNSPRCTFMKEDSTILHQLSYLLFYKFLEIFVVGMCTWVLI
jgi:hypothetical protein